MDSGCCATLIPMRAQILNQDLYAKFRGNFGFSGGDIFDHDSQGSGDAAMLALGERLWIML